MWQSAETLKDRAAKDPEGEKKKVKGDKGKDGGGKHGRKG